MNQRCKSLLIQLLYPSTHLFDVQRGAGSLNEAHCSADEAVVLFIQSVVAGHHFGHVILAVLLLERVLFLYRLCPFLLGFSQLSLQRQQLPMLADNLTPLPLRSFLLLPQLINEPVQLLDLFVHVLLPVPYLKLALMDMIDERRQLRKVFVLCVFIQAHLCRRRYPLPLVVLYLSFHAQKMLALLLLSKLPDKYLLLGVQPLQLLFLFVVLERYRFQLFLEGADAVRQLGLLLCLSLVLNGQQLLLFFIIIQPVRHAADLLVQQAGEL